MNQFREFLLGVADSPTVKVCCFLVIIIQYLTQHLFVMGVAKGRRRSTYPFIGFHFFCQVGKSRFCFTIPLTDKIGMLYILPAVLEFFESAAATFRETSVTNLSFIHKYFTPCSKNSFNCLWSWGACNALITLAMVIGTYIKVFVGFMVVPFNKLRGESWKFKVGCVVWVHNNFQFPICNFQLIKQPASGNNGMCF